MTESENRKKQTARGGTRAAWEGLSQKVGQAVARGIQAGALKTAWSRSIQTAFCAAGAKLASMPLRAS